MAADDFAEFYQGTWRRIVTFVYAMSGDLAEAEDLAQEAYARTWSRWSTVRGYADPESWVRAVAYRLYVSRWRKMRNRLVAYRRHGPAAPADPPTEDTVALVAALRELPDVQRHAIVLHHLLDLPVAEIAMRARRGARRRRLVAVAAVGLAVVAVSGAVALARPGPSVSPPPPAASAPSESSTPSHASASASASPASPSASAQGSSAPPALTSVPVSAMLQPADFGRTWTVDDGPDAGTGDWRMAAVLGYCPAQRSVGLPDPRDSRTRSAGPGGAGAGLVQDVSLYRGTGARAVFEYYRSGSIACAHHVSVLSGAEITVSIVREGFAGDRSMIVRTESQYGVGVYVFVVVGDLFTQFTAPGDDVATGRDLGMKAARRLCQAAGRC